MENPFTEAKAQLEAVAAVDELAAIKAYEEKYKPFDYFGIIVPCSTLVDDVTPACIRDLQDAVNVSKESLDYAKALANCIVDETGEFIVVTSQNQFAFYEALLKFTAFCYVNGIPAESFDGNNPASKYFKIWNVGYLITPGVEEDFEPKFQFVVEIVVTGTVNNKDHASKKFVYFNGNMFKNEPKIIASATKKDHTTRVSIGNHIEFDTKADLSHWLSTFCKLSYVRSNTIVIDAIREANPVYTNRKKKTTDTFPFFQNPKTYIAKTESKNNVINISIFPDFISNVNLLTIYNNFKHILYLSDKYSNDIENAIKHMSI